MDNAYRLLFVVSVIGLAAAMGLGLVAQLRFEAPQPFGSTDHLAYVHRLRQSDPALALEQQRLAARIDVGSLPANATLADWSVLDGDREAEIFSLRRLRRLEPRNAEWRLRLGVALLRSIQEKGQQGLAVDEDELAEVVMHSEIALRLDPDSGRAYRNLGAVSLMQGRPDQAERLFLRAVELRPDLKTAREGLELARKMKAR